jgi:hypothetical protein
LKNVNNKSRRFLFRRVVSRVQTRTIRLTGSLVWFPGFQFRAVTRLMIKITELGSAIGTSPFFINRLLHHPINAGCCRFFTFTQFGDLPGR